LRQLSHGLCMCAIQRWLVKTKNVSAFEQGMVVGARHTATLLDFSCSTVYLVYPEWSTTQRTSSQLDTTVGSIGVNMGQYPCGTVSTYCSPSPDELRLFWGQKKGVPNVLYTQCTFTLTGHNALLLHAWHRWSRGERNVVIHMDDEAAWWLGKLHSTEQGSGSHRTDSGVLAWTNPFIPWPSCCLRYRQSVNH
jgi:hypothetical protein